MKAKPAGYSGKPLARKLGIVEGTSVIALGAPLDYELFLGQLPAGARVVTKLSNDPAFVHLFASARADLSILLEELRTLLVQDGVVWVSWPKKSSKVQTDITEDVIRDVALPMGFVDIKVCAVNETWSGLKLVIRKELRTPAASTTST